MSLNKLDKTEASAGAYISVEQLIKLRYLARDLTLTTRKKSTAIIDGKSKTNFRGRGMEFAEVRPYQAGDDIRNIDWRVTARTLQTYTKLFQEERERPVFIVVDQRSPMFFGSRTVFKSVAAAQLASVIGWIALQNNDRIGALIFGDKEQYDLRAKRGKHAALALVNQLQYFNHQLNSPVAQPDASSSMEEILSDLRRVAKPGSAVFVLSDFHDFNERCVEPLSMLSRHTDVSLMKLFDPLEKQLPSSHELTMSNNQQKLTIQPGMNDFLLAFQQSFLKTQQQIQQHCITAGAQLLNLDIGTDMANHVRDVFSSNHKKRARNRA